MTFMTKYLPMNLRRGDVVLAQVPNKLKLNNTCTSLTQHPYNYNSQNRKKNE